jgi:hypothetical protein
MATGEKSWSSKGKQAKRMSFEPIPAGEYDLKFRGGTAAIKKGKDPKSMPRVSLQAEALNTASSEGGKNRIIFLDLYTSLKPGRDGEVMPERSGQVLDLAKALNEEVNFRTVSISDGDGGTIRCLDARQLKEWVTAHDGVVVKAKVKVKAGTKEYPNPTNQVDYFIASEEAPAEDEDEDETDDEEVEDDASEDIEAAGEEDDEDDEVEEDDAEDEEEPEPTPVPVVKKKAAKPAPAPEPVKKAKKK